MNKITYQELKKKKNKNKKDTQKCHLDVNEVLCFLNESTISSMNAVFSLARPSRPLAHTSNNL